MGCEIEPRRRVVGDRRLVSNRSGATPLEAGGSGVADIAHATAGSQRHPSSTPRRLFSTGGGDWSRAHQPNNSKGWLTDYYLLFNLFYCCILVTYRRTVHKYCDGPRGSPTTLPAETLPPFHDTDHDDAAPPGAANLPHENGTLSHESGGSCKHGTGYTFCHTVTPLRRSIGHNIRL